MGITHSKVSAKADGGDSSLVLPSDWNADHVISGLSPAFIGCGLTNSVDLDMTHNSGEQNFTLDTNIWDTDGFHSTSSNTNRITVPAGLGGKYMLSVTARWSADPGRAYVIARKNASSIILFAVRIDTASDYVSNGSAIVDMAAGDYIELKGLLTNNVNVEATTSDYGPLVTFTKLDSGKVGAGIGASVYNNATQSITSASDTALTFNTEDYDTDGFHNTGSNTDRLTVPTGLSGKYVIIGRTTFPANATGLRQLYIEKNGSTLWDMRVPVNSGTNATSINITAAADLVSGDYVKLRVYQDSGSTLSVGAAGGYTASYFQIMRLDSGSDTTGKTLDYATVTAGVSITATTSTGTACITGNAVNYDGGEVDITVYSPYLKRGNTVTIVGLYMDGSLVTRMGYTASLETPSTMRMRYTPSAGSHTFSVRAWVDGGTGTFGGGDGSSGDYAKGFLLIQRT